MPASSASRCSTDHRNRRQEGGAGKTASVRLLRLTRGAHELVDLDQHAIVFRLRPQIETDEHEGRAEQEADRHHTAMGSPARVVKRRDNGSSPAAKIRAKRETRNETPPLT